MAKTGYSAVKQVAAKAPTAYWYKVNGKKCSKATYNAYKNKPGGDEGGKSTNDPDASGNKAKTEKTRSNNAASKRATVQTKKQSELTPLKQVKKTKKSPLEFDWKNALDNTQTALTAGGMFPALGNAADLVNAGISGGRAAYSKFKGDEKGVKEHMVNAGLNLASAIPIAGQAVAGTKLAVNAASKTAKVVEAVSKSKKLKVGKEAFDKTLQIKEGRDTVTRNFKKGKKPNQKLIAIKKGTPKVNNIA